MAVARPRWRKYVPLPPGAPEDRSEPEALWSLCETAPGGGVARCTLCAAGDGYELLVEGIAGGALRWGYHSLEAAQSGATRLRNRLIANGWTEPAPR